MKRFVHSTLALSVSTILCSPSYANIVITEYIEGTGHNKAIEIANTGTDSLVLTGYTLELDASGDKQWDSALDLSTVTLNKNETYVIVHPEADDTVKAKANTLDSSVTSFNGDDPVALKKDGNIVDIVGTPGTGKTLANTIIRRRDFSPSAVFNVSQFDYISDLSNFAGLGNLNTRQPISKPVPTAATIQEIQGAGWSSTIGGIDVKSGVFDSGDNYFEVTGVITAVQNSSLDKGLAQGFSMQAADDDNPLTSDGIIVDTRSTANLNIGDNVTVVARVKEAYGLTTLVDVYSIVTHGVTDVPKATVVTILNSDIDENAKFDFDKTLERHEGMLIQFETPSMYVTRTFSYDRYLRRNNMVIAYGGINHHPNQHYLPGSPEAKARIEHNRDRRVVVESFTQAENGQVPWYPGFGQASAVPTTNGTTTSDDYIRIGDHICGLQGILSYNYGDFSLYVTSQVAKEGFSRSIPRTESPVIQQGDLKIAAMNVLNYFNSPFGSSSCNPMPPGSYDRVKNTGCNNRGATSDEEFEMQGNKIAAAIVAMDADIVGLMEIENNGFEEDSAIAHLVAKVNALIEDRARHYVYTGGDGSSNYIGNDAITNQVIYRPARVHLDTYRLINMPRQDAPETTSGSGRTESGKNSQRDAITPTFIVKGTVPEQKLTVSVNHFKSKGSPCWEDISSSAQDENDIDLQGNCENLRVSAAQHLGSELAKLKEENNNIMILGDLNSYGSEDPILLLTNMPDNYSVTPARNTFVGDEPMDGDSPDPLDTSFGFINIASKINSNAFSYSYQDTVGTLDYILVSDTMEKMVTDATKWHINAVESPLLQYGSRHTGDLQKFEDVYRSSDHEPSLITLSFSDKPTTRTTPVTPPEKPLNPPKTAEKPEQPVPGERTKVLFNLTGLNTDLHVGDKATLSLTQHTTYNAAGSNGDTTTIVLDQQMIKQGWTVLEIDIPAPGEYQMTKSVISALNHDTTYLSATETIFVESDSPGSSKKSGGGSVPLSGLILLTGLGLIRRKILKQS